MATEILCRWIEVTLNTVVCLVKVNRIYSNTSLLYTMKRMICGKDDSMFTDMITHIYKQFDMIRLSSAEVFCITTVTMQDVSISDVLHILRTELVCQENTRSHNDNVTRNIDLKSLHCIHDCDECFTTTGRNNDLPNTILTESINCFLLVWAKFDHQVQWLQYKGHFEVSNFIK